MASVAVYFFGSMLFSCAWVALIVAAPPCTPSFEASTVKVSEPILIVAMPFLTPVTWPIIAPVLSFTDMPLATAALAPAVADVSAPAPVVALEGGIVEDAEGEAGEAEPGAAELGAEVVGGVALVEPGAALEGLEVVGGVACGAVAACEAADWARAGPARVRTAASAA